MEIRTTQLFASYLWKEGKATKAWVRRYFVLLRREQVDEMVDNTNNVLHEFCQFESDSDHAECLQSLILEEVFKFETGALAGLPPHEKEAQLLLRAKNPKKKIEDHGESNRRTILSNLTDLFPIRFDTSELEDYTIELNLPDRILRVRAETKSIFENWVNLLKIKIPSRMAKPDHQGWMWRYNGRAWLQCFGMLYEGVLFFFKDRETCDMFRMLAVRDEEAVFIAAQLCDDMLSLETCDVKEFNIWEERMWVLQLTVEELSIFISLVDEAQSEAWVRGCRRMRSIFEAMPDDHIARRLFGGLGGEEDGPMIAQNKNPLAQVVDDD